MIKKARLRQGLTQKQLAKRCNLSQSYLSKLEKCKLDPCHGSSPYNISIRQVINIANALNIDPKELAAWFIDKELDSKVEFSTEISFNIYDLVKVIGGGIFENCNISA